MDSFTAFLLGLTQGITEFLPVSSSGHLTLIEYLLGLKIGDEILFFNVFSHLGTLVVVILAFRQDIAKLLKNSSGERLALLLGTLPLVFFVPLFKVIKASFGAPWLLGWSFVFTSAVLFLGDRLRVNIAPRFQPLLVGVAQALALFPGVSRSGMTISAARMFGTQNDEAIRFSFLLAIPATLGALVLETFHLIRDGNSESMPGMLPLFIAVITSFSVGFFALSFLKALGRMGKLGYFAWYCLGVAGVAFYLLG